MFVTEVKVFQGALGTTVQVFDESQLIAAYVVKGTIAAPTKEDPKPIPTVPPAPKPVEPKKADPSVMPDIDVTEYDSPNYSTRGATIDSIICHNTAGSWKSALNTLCDPDAQVSAHLLIGRDGKTACLVDFNKCAWHAGSREWNHRSIGIEIEDYDDAPGMTPAQEAKVIQWIKWLMQKYNIKPNNVRSHRSVCSGTDCPVLIWPKEADFIAWRKEKIG